MATFVALLVLLQLANGGGGCGIEGFTSSTGDNAQTLVLVRQVKDGGVKQTISANKLPTIKDQISVSYWIQPAVTGANKWQPIFVSGPGFGMWFTPKDSLYATVRTSGGATAGLKEIKYTVKPGVWYHVTEVIQGKTQTLYIDGKIAASIDLPEEPDVTVASLTIGGFAGRVKDFRYHNYALSSSEVRAQMGVHPDYKEHEAIQQIWHEQGCVTDLFEDLESNTDLVQMYKAGDEAKVETKLKGIKTAAHRGDKEKLKVCYGPYASKLFAKLQKSGELLKHASNDSQGKKCLPTAPFECRTKSVNDFDIRTHKDFYKYRPAKPQPKPKQLANDVFHGTAGLDNRTIDNIIQTKEDLSTDQEYRNLIGKIKTYQGDVKQHPEYQRLVNKLNKMTADQVEQKTDGYQQLKVQAKKCDALFTTGKGAETIPRSTLVKLFRDRVRTDPTFKALVSNVTESKAASDPDFHSILQRAQDQKYSNDPRFKNFLMKITREQIQRDPVYARTVASMIGDTCPGGKKSIVRLEDHPEYHQYARDIRRECRA